MYVGARVLFFLALELPPSIRFGNEDQPVIRADSRQAELVYSQMENVSPDCYSQVGSATSSPRRLLSLLSARLLTTTVKRP